MNANRTLRLLCTILLVCAPVVHVGASYADNEDLTDELDRPGMCIKGIYLIYNTNHSGANKYIPCVKLTKYQAHALYKIKVEVLLNKELFLMGTYVSFEFNKRLTNGSLLSPHLYRPHLAYPFRHL